MDCEEAESSSGKLINARITTAKFRRVTSSYFLWFLTGGRACVEHQTSPGPSKRQTSPSPEASDEKMEPSIPSASPTSIFTPGDHPTMWPLSTASCSPSASVQQ